ncbi:MAG: hypothetical protein AAB909_03995 [Patescibacteria group bacterium]
MGTESNDKNKKELSPSYLELLRRQRQTQDQATLDALVASLRHSKPNSDGILAIMNQIGHMQLLYDSDSTQTHD